MAFFERTRVREERCTERRRWSRVKRQRKGTVVVQSASSWEGRSGFLRGAGQGFKLGSRLFHKIKETFKTFKTFNSVDGWG